MELVTKYYRGELVSSAETVSEAAGFETGPLAETVEDDKKLKPRKKLRPLLVLATDIAPPALDWIGGERFVLVYL